VSDGPQFESTDKVVTTLAHWLGRLQHALNSVFYRRLAAPFERSHGGAPWLYFNYIYVFCLWTPIVVTSAVLCRWFHGGWWLLLAVVPAWRWLEVAVWWVKLLLDRTHTNILAAERNLLFLLADATAVVTASFVVWRSAEATQPALSWADALAVFTLNGAPPGLRGQLGEVVAIASAASGLILVGAGLALLVNLVGKRIREVPGVYTGPQIPPKNRLSGEEPLLVDKTAELTEQA
jgi:hypothetical protein